MPTVPSYDSFQVAQTALPGGAVRAPEMPDTAGAQAQQLGQGLMRTGDAIGRIQQDVQNKADQVRVDDALNTVTKARTDLQVDALKLKGRNALERPDNKSLPDEYSEKFDQAVNDSAKALGNDVQRAVFKQRADQMRNQLYGSLSSHMVEQQSAFQNETWKSKIETAQNQGALLWGDPAMRAEAGATVASTVDQMSKAQGWDDATKEAAMRDAMSPLHVGIMNGMIKAGHAADAKTYYETNSAGMSLQARATMQSAIKDANDTQTAEGSADDVWSKLGPKITNDPVKIFDMEAELRTQLKDNPDAMKLGLSALRQRASAFNAQQSENNAKGINDVFGLIDAGTSMSDVRRSDAWLSLPEAKRHDISKALDSEAYARESRALTMEQRDFTRMQRDDKLNLLQNADSYLADSAPAALSSASRDQVAALRTKYGLEATQHLLDRWDQLKKSPTDMTDARMDEDSFKRIGKDFGYNTYDPKGAADKENLGTLKYRVERAIAAEQTRAGRKLGQDEKETVMRREFSDDAKVSVGGRLWGSDQVPVIQLDAGQASRVQVPDADRQRIVQKMASRYQTTRDPRFAPTEDNLRYWYLSSKSATAPTIPAK